MKHIGIEGSSCRCVERILKVRGYGSSELPPHVAIYAHGTTSACDRFGWFWFCRFGLASRFRSLVQRVGVGSILPFSSVRGLWAWVPQKPHVCAQCWIRFFVAATPSISTSTMSPSFKNSLRKQPTPDGVPVMIRVPLRRVVPRERWPMI